MRMEVRVLLEVAQCRFFPHFGYGCAHECIAVDGLTLPIPTHTQWITSFVPDSIHTQSIICTLPISSMDNYFLPIPSPFEVGVDLNMNNG
jgi:hypothetical protein